MPSSSYIGDDSGSSPRTSVPPNASAASEPIEAHERVGAVEGVEVDEVEVELPPELKIEPPADARPPRNA